MAERKFQDLTIKNNFMFGAVMAEPKNCKGIIELVLGIEVDHVEVSKEKSMVYHPEYGLMCMQRMKIIQDIILRCRLLKSLPLADGPAIIRARWTWNFF